MNKPDSNKSYPLKESFQKYFGILVASSIILGSLSPNATAENKANAPNKDKAISIVQAIDNYIKDNPDTTERNTEEEMYDLCFKYWKLDYKFVSSDEKLAVVETSDSKTRYFNDFDKDGELDGFAIIKGSFTKDSYLGDLIKDAYDNRILEELTLPVSLGADLESIASESHKANQTNNPDISIYNSRVVARVDNKNQKVRYQDFGAGESWFGSKENYNQMQEAYKDFLERLLWKIKNTEIIKFQKSKK